MLHLRLKALEELKNRRPVKNDAHHKGKGVAEIFGELVFGDKQLKEKLSPTSYQLFRKCIEKGEPLDPNVADQIAQAMKEWALSKGATHYTHWFQPLTGLTAEKHDSFLTFQGSVYDRTLELNFNGKQLIKGEPDASSFPHGGIRSTFEARGYTAWDMSSPSFLRQGTNGNFLCIPTAFASWTGEALDIKTPLLRSNEALSKSTVRVLRLMGDTQVTSAYSQIGVEQEFFMIDRGFYLARPDLVACGRSLLGAQPAKGQQMEDHYFGALDRRVLACIQDIEWRLWQLGMPTTTRHNEVAPSQYEMAPIFEAHAISCDHNMLLMETVKEVAREHDFAALFHEKPFAGVNGSGKHNNWSVSTNTGENLMDPGTTPTKNARFMIMLAAVIRAVHVHGDLLRIAVATPGNDFRLGANEAPPAIISVYTGDLLEEVINELTEELSQKLTKAPSKLQLGATNLPPLPRDASDRNRTSPFAFTGNKFEFRAVGSSQSCARPGFILNTILADSLDYIGDELEKLIRDSKMKPEFAVHALVTKVLKEHKKVVFNGNGYSEEWRQEAEKRGLWHLKTAPEAIKQFSSEKNLAVFAKTKVLSHREVQAWENILLENFSKTTHIEAEAQFNMAQSYIVPVALEYKAKVKASIDETDKLQKALLDEINHHTSGLLAALADLKEVKAKGASFHEEHLFEQATHYRNVVWPAMAKVRASADALEGLVDDKLWPFPKYSEMLLLK